MAIVTFLSNGKEKIGKTLAVTAIATDMAIEHNYKVLVIATKYNDKTLSRCFWEEKKQASGGLSMLLKPQESVSAFEDNIYDLMRVMKSNKLSPDNITDHAKIIFRDRLEILQSFEGNINDYKDIQDSYIDLIKIANEYYDLVLVDLDNTVDEKNRKEIIQNSHLVVPVVSQKLSKIDEFVEERHKIDFLNEKNIMILIPKYDGDSKYNTKNISRYMGEKNKIVAVPYNTLYFEASEEGKVADLFLKLKRPNDSERNTFFMEEIKRTCENIMYRIQDLQARM